VEQIAGKSFEWGWTSGSNVRAVVIVS